VRVLLDTCVLSELRHPKGNAGVRRTVDAFDSESLFVSVLSIGEIAKGIALLTESQNKRALQIWLQTLELHYGDRLLPVDLETSRIWGELTAAVQRVGRNDPAGDGLIAATGRRHGGHVMTQNILPISSRHESVPESTPKNSPEALRQSRT
jgi:predicted nucleic acid-binding protein